MKKISIEQNLTISIDPTLPLRRYYPTDKFVHVYKSLWDSLAAQWLKNLPANAGDSISELGRFPGEGKGNPLQYSCLGNPMDRGAWQSMGLQKSHIHLATKQQQQRTTNLCQHYLW